MDFKTQKMLDFVVRTDYDAFRLLNVITDSDLHYTEFICFVGNYSYTVYYDIDNSLLRSTAYPFTIKSMDIRQAFKDAIFAIYHTNFL